MTRANYYASTVRNLKDVAQYFVYPISKVFFHYQLNGTPGAERKAAIYAGAVGAGFYAALTTNFFGKEATQLDVNAREAVSAELGMRPEDMQFADYWKSNNSVVKIERDDLMYVQKVRYLTDALFLLPLALEWNRKAIPGLDKALKATDTSLDKIRSRNKDLSIGQFISNYADMFNNLIYAGKSAYWYYETFNIDKSAHYEVVKLRELFEATGKDIGYNELLPILQRCRQDQGKPMYNKREREALRPVLMLLSEKCNATDKFGISEVLYLIGTNKIRIHGPDGRTISQEAIDESMKDIDHLDRVGLEGIREENRRAFERLRREGVEPFQPSSFADKVKGSMMNAAYNAYQMVNGKSPKSPNFQFKEYISSRDPDMNDPHEYLGR